VDPSQNYPSYHGTRAFSGLSGVRAHSNAGNGIGQPGLSGSGPFVIWTGAQRGLRVIGRQLCLCILFANGAERQRGADWARACDTWGMLVAVRHPLGTGSLDHFLATVLLILSLG